jgi:hypothetical protein
MKKFPLSICCFALLIIGASSAYADIFTPESDRINRISEAMRCEADETEVSCVS